ncbi:hypothetical protein PAAG_00576 [Paracoccidioides lutzii Pb01]|uniref:Uncharacterized protein n=1 Tax=Paracoccidioides lutzii (strain ATCC MYA-826 / Pb01) TaxID=502779 RepID=C1GPY1_PARBA|nr:hypothetical protein PAAG_00576 [Paracoccidioides lutzii Pb01]EEH36253.2 hypothetical protein PAAG_00576 [Paracoccidioides lutzii Pb01]
MVFEDKFGEPPDEQPTFRGIKLLGNVQGDYEKVFKDICLEIEAPKKQFDGAKRPYLQNPLRRYQQWTAKTI